MRHPRTLTLVLAGGVGGRLELLTEHRAKPALPFAGSYRLIDIALSNCVHSGLSDVWIVEQYETHSLNEHLANGRPWDLDRTYGGLRVLPPHEVRGEERQLGGFAQGNADALYRNLELIRGFGAELLVVLSADHVYRLDYREVIDRHLERAAEVTMVTTRVAPDDASRYGLVQVDGEGRVVDFDYKPDEPDTDLATAEVFVYDAEVLLAVLERLAMDRNEDGEPAPLNDFGHALLPELVRRGRAYEYPLDGYWRDLGTPESYWAAHMDVLEGTGVRLDDPEWRFLTSALPRLPARVEGTARIESSLISPGCVVRGRVVRSVLAPGVVVEEGAVVEESVVLADTRIRGGTRVTRTIIDEGADIESGAIIGAAAAELVLVGGAARIGSGARVAAGQRVQPAAVLE